MEIHTVRAEKTNKVEIGSDQTHVHTPSEKEHIPNSHSVPCVFSLCLKLSRS